MNVKLFIVLLLREEDSFAIMVAKSLKDKGIIVSE